ncbi:sensor histidine kinase [Gynurincola endophyticus]|uniref:sensor histidine kinase n=1 Tax=Gynurincola endophyticus TaxID=2479004 RepID=UPI000F8EBD96|nr:ATP-binding protein [Gynurincola endophyticus]
MPGTKNLTTQQLSALCAISIALPVAIGFYLVSLKLLYFLISLVIVFGAGYYIIHFLVDKYVNRKIKLIYKLIQQTKSTKKEEMYFKYLLPQKTVDDVRKDVEEWSERFSLEYRALLENERYRKEFLQNLSHELKTPIFAIQGYVDSLLDGALDNEKIAQRFLENTNKNVDRLVDLVNDLDQISRLEMGQLPLNKQYFIIQDLVKEIFDLLSIHIHSKQIKTGIKKGCEHPIQVYADKEKIKQVLINIIENATKYGKEKGHITASFYKTDDDNVLIEISDDGFGIEQQNLQRIFERFFRTDSARSREIGGSGLGLAICKHIIEAHGHSIHARSRVDIGTTIGFSLSTAE